ncbi:tetratricopeptide repeat-containing sulfotransferase family protein [Alteromonas facilis]|uniref:tetratricopeptide repeat-containing sulfotransferase family protein n=1 Tax=Alteromonas facilis TaxID=2048004 RepID=UPI000C28B102|nr:tetratricopeptide repeat-containing sulfotransferase family protein [Alteromonas facilis]
MSDNQHQQVLLQVERYFANDQLAHAIALLNQYLKQSPFFYQGWLRLSKCLFHANYFTQASDIARHAEQFDPFVKEFERIQHCMQQEALSEASRIASSMLEKCPHHPRAIFTLSHLALLQNRPEESVALLEREIPHLPANITLRNMLVDSYSRSGNFTLSLKSAHDIVEFHESFDSLWKWIGLLLKYSQHDTLIDACSRAAEYAVNDTLKQSQLALIKGQALRIKGERDASVSALKYSISQDPNNTEAWLALADMKNYTFNKDETQQIRATLESTKLSRKSKAIATFALAKATEMSQGIAQSMPLYEEANRLAASDKFFTQSMLEEFDARRKAFSRESLSTQALPLENQPRPIFIVGMPRSGSTLVEQMLSSHPEIEGTIEQPTLPSVELKANNLCRAKYQSSLFNSVGRLTQEELSHLGVSYIEQSRLFRHTDLAYFIDKQPFNYRLIGLIHKILPDAIIIDVRRSPMDCGFSLFKQYFYSGVEFSYRLKDIAVAINAYNALMDHWHEVLPNSIVTVHYEDLVNEPEKQLKRLLTKIGICFDEQCLNFHENKRSVHTASSEQVREPLHNRSIHGWQKAEGWLKELQDNLQIVSPTI